MPDLRDGESVEMPGSGSRPYVLKNIGGVYSCSCPAWRNQSLGIERRTCKHLRRLRGDAAEDARLGQPLTTPALSTSAAKPTAPPLLLAESWDGQADPTGWWLSEKLDGVRAYWDGQQFLSRQGNRFFAPAFFTARFPATSLDGELWLGRRQFQRTVSIVRRQDESDLWRELSYRVFDAPELEDPFEERLRILRAILPFNSPYLGLHPHAHCTGSEHLRQELARIEGLGGEGLMLRQPGSRYEGCRSGTLLKVKSFKDTEARVIEHQPGTGRHRGRLGALLAELPDGTRFAVGTGLSDAQRESPPSIGSLITVRYQELTDRGVPRFPSFVGLRAEPLLAVTTPSTSRPTVPSSTLYQETPTMTTATAHATRRFEFQEGTSAKFWEITQNRTEVTVRYGRLGTDGQTQNKLFVDVAAAQKHTEKLIREKTGKGYREVA